MVDDREPRAAGGIGIEPVREALLDRGADLRVDRVRPPEQGTLHVEQRGPVARARLGPDLGRDRAPGRPGQAEIADQQDIVSERHP